MILARHSRTHKAFTLLLFLAQGKALCSRSAGVPGCWQSHSKTPPVTSLLHCFAAVTSAAAERRTGRCMLPVAHPVVVVILNGASVLISQDLLELRGADAEDHRIRQGIELWFCFLLTKL